MLLKISTLRETTNAAFLPHRNQLRYLRVWLLEICQLTAKTALMRVRATFVESVKFEVSVVRVSVKQEPACTVY